MKRFFQVIIDCMVGLAFYYGLKVFVPVLESDIIIVITLVVTALFAEFVEFDFKRGN